MNRAAVLLAIDPGTQKCGVAVVASGDPPQTLYRVVTATPELVARITKILATHPVEMILVGDATYGKTIAGMVRPLLPPSMPVHFVPEAYTSERAKKRWLQANPPRQLWEKLFPGFRTPTEAIDDYAAVILAEDWLTKN